MRLNINPVKMYIQIVKVKEMLKSLELFLINTEYTRKNTPGLSHIKRRIREIKSEVNKLEEMYNSERSSTKSNSKTAKRDKKRTKTDEENSS